MTYGRISKKQQEILDYMKNEILNRGFPPSVREICEAVNLKSTLFRSLPYWKLWKKTDISAEMPPSPVRSRSLMIISIWSAARLSMFLL